MASLAKGKGCPSDLYYLGDFIWLKVEPVSIYDLFREVDEVYVSKAL